MLPFTSFTRLNPWTYQIPDYLIDSISQPLENAGGAPCSCPTHVVSNKLNEKQRLGLVVSFYLIKIKMTHHSLCWTSFNLQRVPVSIMLIIDSSIVSIDGVIKSFSLQSQEKVVADSPDLK